MSDLVTRLRDDGQIHYTEVELCMEAADEIERLRAELKSLEESIAPWRELQAENKTLKEVVAIAEMEKTEPYGLVYEYNGYGGTHRSFRYYERNGRYPTRTVEVFTHPAQSRDEPNFIDLLKEANEIVKGKSVYKRFMVSTPLENDVPVWMADFAMEHGIYQPVEPTQSRDDNEPTYGQLKIRLENANKTIEMQRCELLHLRGAPRRCGS